MVTEERREHHRSSLAMPARVRRLSHSQSAMVRDLSRTGCKLVTAEFTLIDGNRVLIRPTGFESLLGTVIWSQSGAAGVKFDEALDQSTVDQFCILFPDLGTSVLLDIAA
jgi:hypothetical protein